VLPRLADKRFRLLVVLVERSLGELEQHDCVHQPLLRAVVQVPNQAAPGVVPRGEQPRPRRRELVTAVRVRDGGVEQLRELSHPLLGVARRRLLAPPVRNDDAPEPAFDDDRRPDRRAHTQGLDKFSNRAARPVVVLHPGGPLCAPHRCRHALGLRAHACTGRHERLVRPGKGQYGDLGAGS
jgi:hypothetical protein